MLIEYYYYEHLFATRTATQRHRLPTVDPIRAAEDPALDSLEQSALDHLWFHVTPPGALRTPGGMIVFAKGEGCYLTDIHGRRYLDGLSGGAFVTNIGHGRKEVADAYAEQAAELAYVSPYNFAAPPTIALASKLAELATATGGYYSSAKLKKSSKKSQDAEGQERIYAQTERELRHHP